MDEDDGARACAEEIESLVITVGCEWTLESQRLAQEIIRAYRDREVAGALAEQGPLRDRAEYVYVLRVLQEYREAGEAQVLRAESAEARVAEQAGEIERLIRERDEYKNLLYEVDLNTGKALNDAGVPGHGRKHWERIADLAGEVERLRSHIEHALNTLGAGRSDVARTFEILRAATNG
jgi:hypothetical protein